ncbi:conserved virulence factor C family protein [Chungangia koreensis]|uniref:Conserved virulence factor C family protein n=1 Tax=Chungangia koreensis TaxID=752657 RepID=A0ABV8X6X6_9LACT
MNILTVEPTPSPNSMKIVVDQELPFGVSHNYKKEEAESAPPIIASILSIEGVKGVYHVADFLAVDRHPKYEWETILSSIREAFGESGEKGSSEEKIDEHYGEVYVHVQQYKGIPLQVKVFDGTSEERFGLSNRFVDAMNQAMDPDDENYILQRKWADYGVRYGDKKDIGENVLKEIEAAYTDDRLKELIQNSKEKKQAAPVGRKVTLEEFMNDDWQTRYRLLDQMADPDVEDLPLLDKALEDEQMSIRRLATVYLGMVDHPDVVPFLEKALKDKSASVRRTAGDCMSDLGFEEFEDAMIEALKDKNKLVRWRAAMFLYETGTEKSLPALKAAEDDQEFEVKLQVKMALARIEEGEEAKGSVWKQMTEARKAGK